MTLKDLIPYQLTLGSHEVRLAAPTGMSDDPEGRIFLWWGLTGSAIALARSVVDNDNIDRKTVIELGCGLGLPGMAAGLSGARVLFTDIKPEALEYARRNVAANRLESPQVDFATLDWENPELEERYDIVLGAEILYDYFMHDSLLKLIDRLLAPGGTLMLADRKRLVVDRFMGRLHTAGFRTERRDLEIEPLGEPVQTISVYSSYRP